MDAATLPLGLSVRHRWALVGLGAVAMALSFLERQTLSVLAPTVCGELGLSNAEYGWASSAFSFAILVGTPVAGVLLDRVGVRRGLLAAVILWSLVSAAHGLLAGFASLVALRLLLGLAEAPTFPGSMHVVRTVLPAADVPRGIGITLTGPTFGFLAALFVAVALEQRFGWRAAFFGVASISLAWTPLWTALTSAGAAPELLRVPRERSKSGPAWSLFAQPLLLRALVFTACIGPMLAFSSLWWAKFLTARHGIPQAAIARYGFLPPLAYDLGAVVFGDLASRARAAGSARRENALMIAAVLLSLCAGLMGLPAAPWSAVAIGTAAYFGVGGAFAMCNAGALSAVPAAQVSRAAALVATSFQLSLVIANPLIGRAVDRTGDYNFVLGALPPVLLAGAIAWLWLGRVSDARPAPPSGAARPS